MIKHIPARTITQARTTTKAPYFEKTNKKIYHWQSYAELYFRKNETE